MEELFVLPFSNLKHTMSTCLFCVLFLHGEIHLHVFMYWTFCIFNHTPIEIRIHESHLSLFQWEKLL